MKGVATFIMHYDQKEIAQRIKTERMKLGCSQEVLAEILDKDRNTISAWERQNKGRIPPHEHLLKMCTIFKCEIGYLLGEHDCKTRAVTDIQNTTGLSEKSINSILKLKQNHDKREYVHLAKCKTLFELFDLLLSHDNFYSLLCLIGRYARLMSDAKQILLNDTCNDGLTENDEIELLDNERIAILWNIQRDFTNIVDSIAEEGYIDGNTQK